MFEYTYENHFKIGYNGVPFGPPNTDPSAVWYCEFGKCTRKPMSFAWECMEAASLIYERCRAIGEVPNVLFSGGLESEIVVRCFQEHGHPFKVSILQFKKNLNIHDIAYAVIACENLGIDYDIIPLDLEWFWETMMDDYAIKYGCCSPQLPATMWLADHVEGVPVMGSGEPYVMKMVPEGYVPGESPYTRTTWEYYECERINSLYQPFLMEGRAAVPGFFQYTPEQIYSFMTDPVVRSLVNDERVGKLSTRTSKGLVYRKHFDLIERTKYDGYEKMRELEEIYREHLREELGLAVHNRGMGFEYYQYMEDTLDGI